MNLSNLRSIRNFGLGMLAWAALTAIGQAQGPDPLTVYAYNSGPTPASPSQVNQPVSWSLTASYVNPPSGNNYCTLNGPTWDIWSLSVQYSPDDPNNPSTAPPDSYSISVYQDDPTIPDATLQFTPYASGYWYITADMGVSFDDGPCGDAWTATGTTLLFLVVAPDPPLPFKTFSSPNSANAIHNEYIEQVLGNTEVLLGWKIKYVTTNPNIDATKPIIWYFKNVSTGNVGEYGRGATLEQTQRVRDTYDIWYEATDNAGAAIVSTKRREVISELTPTNFAVKLPVAAAGGGLYKRNEPTIPDYVDPPQRPNVAITFAGRLDYATGAPMLTKFKCGMVQSIQGERTAANKYVPPPVWDPASPAGTTLTIPRSFSTKSIPAPPKIDHKAPGILFYTAADVAIAAAFSSNDTPSSIMIGTFKPPDSVGNLAAVTYTMDGNQKFTLTFVDWITAYNAETKQVAPLQQAGWTLAWDTSVAIGVAPTYKATEVPTGVVATPLVDPTMSVIPFNTTTKGANVTETK